MIYIIDVGNVGVPLLFNRIVFPLVLKCLQFHDDIVHFDQRGHLNPTVLLVLSFGILIHCKPVWYKGNIMNNMSTTMYYSNIDNRYQESECCFVMIFYNMILADYQTSLVNDDYLNLFNFQSRVIKKN